MAAIDKTYVYSPKDYIDLVEWAKNAVYTCPNGTVIKISNSVYEWNINEIKDWSRGIPVLNTSYTEDYYLIKYCPLEVVQNRMKEVYSKDYYDSIKNGTSEWDTFTKEGRIGTKIVLKKYSPHENFNYYCKFADVQIRFEDRLLWYSNDIKNFLWPNELGNTSSSGMFIRKSGSIKAIIRKLRKLNLPKGAKIFIVGRYVHEKWILYVK